MKKISLEELLPRTDDYQEQYDYIQQMISDGLIKPVGRSPMNGKKPALHTSYHVIEPMPDYSEEIRELHYKIRFINIDYYTAHPDVYRKEREQALQLEAWLKHKDDVSVSENERRYEIWGYEKFNETNILKHCGIDKALLNTYKTVEPFAYYSHTRKTPQKLLIIENKDPFYGMRKHLLAGHDTICGEEIGTLIYVGGNGVGSSLTEFESSAEPYMLADGNELLYIGDLDYAGIRIYETLVELTGLPVKPFVKGYKTMLDKAVSPGKCKKNQAFESGNRFFSYFDSDTANHIRDLLAKGLYIPQEILTIKNY